MKPLAIVYTRVSTGQQAESGLSLDAQERQVVARAEADGYTVEVVEEAGRSGKSLTGRPLLAAALDRLDAGEAQALYVAKLDRLARNAHDATGIAERAERRGWRLVIVDMGIDTSTSTGLLMLTVLAGVARFELDSIRDRHRAWHAEARERGKVWGVDYGPRSPLPPEVEERIWQAHAEGRSYRSIAEELKTEEVPTANGGTWQHGQVRKVVERQRRAGRTVPKARKRRKVTA